MSPSQLTDHHADCATLAKTAHYSRERLVRGETIYPLVRAADDFAAKSVTLLVNGQPVGTSTTSPYALSWTPSTQDEGDKVSLQAIVADSSGQQSRTHELTIKVAR